MKTTEEERVDPAETPPAQSPAKGGSTPKMGGESGSNFMEYVIIAILIAAACAAAIAYFGRSVAQSAGVATQAMSGDCCGAAMECRSAADHDASSGVQAAEKFSRGDGRSEWGGEERKRRDKFNDSTVTPVPIPDDGGTTPSDEFKK